MVLAILGMLAAIAVPQVLKYLGRAKGVAKVQEQALGTSLDRARDPSALRSAGDHFGSSGFARAIQVSSRGSSAKLLSMR